MKRFLPGLLVLLALCGARPASAEVASSQPADTTAFSLYDFRMGWFSRDKAYHAAGSALGAAGVYALSRQLGLGRLPSAIVSSLVVGTAGLIRETYHAQDPNLLNRSSFSRKDMAWNVAGIAVGISVTDVLFRSRSSREKRPAP